MFLLSYEKPHYLLFAYLLMILEQIVDRSTVRYKFLQMVYIPLQVYQGHLLCHHNQNQEHLVDTYEDKSMPSSNRKSTRLNSSHVSISYAVFCLKKKKDI